MNVYKLDDLSIKKILSSYENATLGFFDGVHKGHKKILDEMMEEHSNGVIITFDIMEKKKPSLISIEDKLTILSNYTQNKFDIILINLNSNVMSKSKDEFIEFLKKLGIKNIYVGEDYRFGYKASGNLKDLKEEFNVNVIDYYLYKEEKLGTKVIKKILEKGEINNANKNLGYLYYLKGTVIHGEKLGRKLGFPTVNIQTNQFLPKIGVYKTKTKLSNGEEYLSVTNIGNKPTFGNNKIGIETHIVDSFNKDLYNEVITISFLSRLRDEKTFNNIEELKNQIKEDIEIVKGVKE